MKVFPVLLALLGAGICLSTHAQERLDEIVVVASRSEMPLRQVGASVSLIGSEEIELRGYPLLADLLRTQPGIAVSNAGGPGKQTALRIRGEEAFRTLVLIDGVNMSDPGGSQVQPQTENFLSGSDIERVEILRGPQGFIYGADAGGVVNITTRSSAPGFSGRVGAELGAFDTRKLDGFLAYGGDRGDVFVSALDFSTDGFNAFDPLTLDSDNVSSEYDHDETDGYQNTTYHAKLGWNILPSTRAQLVLRDVSGRNEYDNCRDANNLAHHDCVGLYRQSTAKATFDHKGEALGQSFGLTQSDISREYHDADAPSTYMEGRLQKAEYLAQMTPTEWLAVLLGTDYQTEQASVVDGENRERDQLGGFTELQLAFDQHLYFTAGARYDDHQDFGEHLSARLTSAYIHTLSPASSLKLRASAGNGFRAPSLYEITYNRTRGSGRAAETALTEEQSRGYDLGLEYHRDGGVGAQIVWFEQTIEDEIQFDLLDFSGYVQADGRSHSRGWEIALELPVASYLRLDANFTRNHTQTAAGLPRNRRPGKLLNISAFVYPAAGFTLAAHSRWVREAVHGETALDDYQLVDLSASWAASDRLEVYARVQNALDEDYREIPDYNTAGRSAFAGARFSF